MWCSANNPIGSTHRYQHHWHQATIYRWVYALRKSYTILVILSSGVPWKGVCVVSVMWGLAWSSHTLTMFFGICVEMRLVADKVVVPIDRRGARLRQLVLRQGLEILVTGAPYSVSSTFKHYTTMVVDIFIEDQLLQQWISRATQHEAMLLLPASRRPPVSFFEPEIQYEGWFQRLPPTVVSHGGNISAWGYRGDGIEIPQDCAYSTGSTRR
ncbi:hypothetical protein F5887DRAFT_918815 [Amanita rubescens]|nr:hypothetical protein F5887DRAFT_918815 [Amanita rubescens]